LSLIEPDQSIKKYKPWFFPSGTIVILLKILSTYFIAYLIFWTLLHEYGVFPTDCIEGNFNQAILIWVFFFIIPLGLIVLGIDFFKNAINNFKTLNNNSRAPFYL